MNKKQLIVTCIHCSRKLNKEEAVEVTALYFGRRSKRILNKIVYFDIECFTKKQIKWDKSIRKAERIEEGNNSKLTKEEERRYKAQFCRHVIWDLRVVVSVDDEEDFNCIDENGLQADVYVKAVYKGEELLYVAMGSPKRLKKLPKQPENSIKNRIRRR